MIKLHSVVLALSVAFTSFSLASADDELQAVVERSAESYIKAFAARDAAALTQLFTPEAEYHDTSGLIFHGRASIEAEFASTFETLPEGKLDLDFTAIRPIAENVLIEEGTAIFTLTEDGSQTHSLYEATHVRLADGNWLMASVREIAIAEEPTPHDQLQALQWLIGSWREEVDGTAITTEWGWSDDGNFLISQFIIQQTAKTGWTGTHRIGWDAEKKRFRSWIFNSEGSFAEGWWRANEDGSWTLSLSQVNSLGQRVEALMTYEPDGTEAILVSRSQVVHDGHSVDGSSHRIVRQPPGPDVKAAP